MHTSTYLRKELCAVLRLHKVKLCYNSSTILSEVSLQAFKGQVVAMVGGSGSGKTTLLRAIVGQVTPHSGNVEVFGKDISSASFQKLNELRKRIGVLFQQGALFTDLNVYENVAFPLSEHMSLSNNAVRKQVLSTLDAVGLRAAAHLRLNEISGGMARRVALARAIVLKPELILYDEPFVGLDPISLGVTARLIRTLTDRTSCASIIITHDIHETFAISNQVYLIGCGTLLASGTPKSLTESQDPYVRQFLNGNPDGPISFSYPQTSAFEQWLQYQKKNEV